MRTDPRTGYPKGHQPAPMPLKLAHNFMPGPAWERRHQTPVPPAAIFAALLMQKCGDMRNLQQYLRDVERAAADIVK